TMTYRRFLTFILGFHFLHHAVAPPPEKASDLERHIKRKGSAEFINDAVLYNSQYESLLADHYEKVGRGMVQPIQPEILQSWIGTHERNKMTVAHYVKMVKGKDKVDADALGRKKSRSSRNLPSSACPTVSDE